ncbi:response regulator [Sphingomonas carotinifaciens]|uniref:Response regulator n=1 Tax=Sphingomonas carotinifaciens TaxID=1166323 RepID=A0A1G7PCI7_9SPHN|nr:response regulator [Sphingomonas carotinifaciens]MWC44582.1 response regulator [Sphingomonas carotinifaciens]SDF84022.1 Response regulator receiver domain-containing protein [Sphingomonas carotinifaciens]
MVFGRKKRNIVRLLVVEDEPLVAFDTEHLLSDAAYEIVKTVDTVAGAVDVLHAEEAIDLVLADVRLADGSGLDVARAAHARGVPVLFVTGSFPEEAIAFAAGYLAKPYAQRDLLNAIAAIDSSLSGERPGRLPAGFQLFAVAVPAPTNTSL